MTVDRQKDAYDNDTHKMIQKWIDEQHWYELEAFVHANPRIAHDTTFPNGWTLLHCVTSTANTPLELIRTVAAANPNAIGIPDKRFQDLPVHFVCRNLQISAAKLHVLLQYGSSNWLLHRNEFGGTPLHSACNHNARLEALQALVQATDAQILRVRTFQGHHCVTTLWQSYSSTIQGHLCVANLLLPSNIQLTVAELPRHFQLFWDKCQFLALSSYAASSSPQDLLHALLRCNVPIHLFKVAVRLVKDEAFLTADKDGLLPLHWVLQNRPYPHLHEADAIEALLQHGEAAVPVAQELPLMMAIRHKIPWSRGIHLVWEAYPSAIQSRSIEGWYPFLLAAVVGGKPLPSLETIFQLLRVQPDLLLTSSTTRDGQLIDRANVV
jgi:ankyrin repeat protein